MASVYVIVKGMKGESPAPEPAIKEKRSCLLDREKRSVHGKARGDSWEMEKSKWKSALSNMTLTLLHTLEGKKIFLVDGIGRRRPTTPNVKATIEEMVIIPGG